ncbi:hypothetical protein Hanom_Chr05g00386201 [Helianthus anomalus]
MESRRPAERDGRRSGSENNGIPKFYVARLPDKCSSKDISEVLGLVWEIEGVYISRKKR